MKSWIAALFFLAACTSENRDTQAVVSPGQALLQSKGCTACHSINGQPGVGPTFKGLNGRREVLADGTAITVDEAYVRESIRTPLAKVVRGFTPSMPAVPLTEDEANTIVAYILSL